MKDLLKLEFHKLKRQKSFYVCLGIMIALTILAAVVQKYLPKMTNNMLPADEMEGVTITVDEIPADTFVVNAAVNSSFILLSAIFVCIVYCEDYDQHILKNTFARGYSRKSVFFAKIIHIYTACTIMFVLVALISVAIAVSLLGLKSIEASVLKLIGVQYLVCMAYTALHIAICSMIRKMGISIVICILVQSLVTLVLGIIQRLLKLENPVITNYWLDGLLLDTSVITTTGERLVKIAIASAVYLMGLTALGRLFSSKVEV